MPFEFKKTEIEGLMLIKPHMYPDERGLYKKYYEKNINIYSYLLFNTVSNECIRIRIF